MGMVSYNGKCYIDCQQISGKKNLLLQDGVCKSPGISKTALTIIIGFVVIVVLSIIAIVLYLFLGHKISCVKSKDLQKQTIPMVSKYKHDSTGTA